MLLLGGMRTPRWWLPGHTYMRRLFYYCSRMVLKSMPEESMMTPLWCVLCEMFTSRLPDCCSRKAPTSTLLDAALVLASRNGQEQVQLLLEKGVDIDTAGKYYHTALVCASRDGHDQMVQLLLKKGADVNFGRPHVDTALVYASRNGHKRIVQLLLDGMMALRWCALREQGTSRLSNYCSRRVPPQNLVPAL